MLNTAALERGPNPTGRSREIHYATERIKERAGTGFPDIGVCVGLLELDRTAAALDTNGVMRLN
jgi:hypothetical protein